MRRLSASTTLTAQETNGATCYVEWGTPGLKLLVEDNTSGFVNDARDLSHTALQYSMWNPTMHEQCYTGPIIT